MTGPWMYWKPAQNPREYLNIYHSRARRGKGHGLRACETEVHYFFQQFDIPMPVERFRVIIRPVRFGEWYISRSLSLSNLQFPGFNPTRLIHETAGGFVMRYVGLSAPDLPISRWGKYDLWVEYYELSK